MSDFYAEMDGFIQIFKFSHSTDTAMQQWADAFDTYVLSIPKSEPFYILLDVTGDRVAFTPTVRQTAKHVFSTHRDHIGYLAMIFEWRTSPYFARLFFASIGKLNFKLNYFTNAGSAKDWLQSNR